MLAALAAIVTSFQASGATPGHYVEWHGTPQPYETYWGTWYNVPWKAGALTPSGKLNPVVGTNTLQIPEDDIDFYFQVANRYISTEKPQGSAAKVFEATDTYRQPVGGLTKTWYAIEVKGSGGGGGGGGKGNSLTGTPKKIYKSSTKIGKDIAKVLGATSAAEALRRLRPIIKSLKKVEKILEKEAKAETPSGATDTSGWLHPGMIKSPKKALTLTERAARTQEQKARDKMLERAQDQIDKLNRKLEKLGSK